MQRSEVRRRARRSDEGRAGLALAAGGTGTVFVPDLANRAKSSAVARRRARSIGTLGGLSAEGRPVDPATLSGRQMGKLPTGGRRPSPRRAAITRYRAANSPFEHALAKPAIGRRLGGAVRGGGLLTALAGVGLAIDARRRVRKDLDELAFVSPQDGLGIPITRRDPINPLAMAASSSIMADFIIGASGRNLSRKDKKKIRRGAWQFAGAKGMLYSPLGAGMRTQG